MSCIAPWYISHVTTLASGCYRSPALWNMREIDAGNRSSTPSFAVRRGIKQPVSTAKSRAKLEAKSREREKESFSSSCLRFKISYLFRRDYTSRALYAYVCVPWLHTRALTYNCTGHYRVLIASRRNAGCEISARARALHWQNTHARKHTHTHARTVDSPTRGPVITGLRVESCGSIGR